MQHSKYKHVRADQKVAEMLLDNPFLMLLLEHFDIPLGVQEHTVEQLCQEHAISKELFITIANLYNGHIPVAGNSIVISDVLTIIHYLKNCHLYYQNEKYPQIKSLIRQIYEVNTHAEVLMIDKFVDEYIQEVTEHLEYENKTVFPYVLELHKQLIHKQTTNIQVTYSVIEYKEQHNDIEEKLNDLKNILLKYLPQHNDRQLRRNLLLYLVELEYDLNIHSLIEDSILIPLVEKMESLIKEEQ